MTARASVLPEPPQATPNGLAEAFAAIAARHGRPITLPDILARLPYDPAGLTLPELVESAPSLGFDVHVARILIPSIPAISLPAIVLDNDGGALVLTGIDNARGIARIILPATGPAEHEITILELAARHGGIVAFVRPSSAVGPGIGNPDTSGHWFWSVFRTFRRDYAQVVLAAFLINLLGIAVPLFVKNVYDRVIPNFAIPTLWALTAGVLLALVLDIVLRTLRAGVVDTIGRRVDLAVAGRLFDRILRVRLASRPASAGALASQLRDFDSVRDVLTSSTLIAATDLVFIGIFIAVLWALVGPIALVPSIGVLLVVVAALAIQLPLSRAVEASQQASARRQGLLVEATGSLETVKSIGAEPMLRRMWKDAVAATSRTMSDARYWASLSASLVVMVGQAVSIAIVVWGVFLVLDGTITVGALIAASILAGRVLAPLGNIVQTLARAHQAMSAYRTLDAMMTAPAEAPSSGDGRSPRLGDITLSRVALTYPGTTSPALDDITLVIRKGERVGLVGRIGSGKTSIGRLLAGLYEPTSGQVLIDGEDIRHFGAGIRSLVGFCPQEVELFTGSLRDNIVLGAPDADAAAVDRAMHVSGVEAFASRHPMGLAMPIAERGRSLSGGQRQAIGLARTLVKRPRILILDEPSSAMDTATERALTASLKASLAPDDILILSTHRDGLLDLVDRLVVLDAGRIVADGPKADVLARLRDGRRPPARPVAVGEGTSS